mmetsp:Transcript_36123/g.83765  ORF Transcript_36123/g.83765 Transcript_36123/m.83765 type:complete len:245 (-) Transcript_36123:531-1265(-)
MSAEHFAATAEEEEAKEALKSNRQIRCARCRACTASDCGACPNCMDMPKFGGPGHKKQACTKRKCLQLTPCKTRKLEAQSPKRLKANTGTAVRVDLASSDELEELMLIAEGGLDSYCTPRGMESDFPGPEDAHGGSALLPGYFSLDDELRDRSDTTSLTALKHPSQPVANEASAFASIVTNLNTSGSTSPDSSAPTDAQICAVTQADVAAAAQHGAFDQKLDWSWLALANLEDEFVSMPDLLQL